MSIDVVSIDTGIPVPERVNLLNIMRNLNSGESFVIPLSKRRQVQTYASRLKKDEGRHYTIRREGEVARVWRLDG